MTSYHQLFEVIPGLSEFQGNYLKILVQFEKGMPFSVCTGIDLSFASGLMFWFVGVIAFAPPSR